MDNQQKQKEVINKIEELIRKNSLKSSVVNPVEDFDNDPRICLTSVHFPADFLQTKIHKEIIIPLQENFPEHYYYSPDSLHLTIKNVRVINNPPRFNGRDIKKARQVFSQTVPGHFKFRVFFYRFLLFPNNLSLIGTTEEELDKIILDLDRELKAAGIPDDKLYTNSKYFFSNMTLARFNKPVTGEFREKVKKLFDSLSFEPYLVDSVTLLTCNAVFKQRKIIGSWGLR